MSAVTIRSMTVADVREVARVHIEAFPGFFLTFLGPGFLRELYRGIVRDPDGIAFVAVRDGACAGFVAGSASPAGLYKRLMKRRIVAFAFHAGLAFLRKPSVAPRLLRAFTRSSEAPPAESGRAELMSLAVLPGNQGGGLGGRLVEAFVESVRSRGGAAVFLTTDAVGNDAVNAFYERLGFVRSRRFATPEGREMNEYSLQVRA
jgi:ribosomal protein S18 acetylase RimI-like enzyme